MVSRKTMLLITMASLLGIGSLMAYTVIHCTRTGTGSATQRKHVLTYLGLRLPNGAHNIFCQHSLAFVYWGFLRFDASPEEVDNFLAENKRLPGRIDLVSRQGLIPRMAPSWSVSDWWNPQDVHTVQAGTNSGQLLGANGTLWRWEYILCVGELGQGTERVYLSYTEDPV